MCTVSVLLFIVIPYTAKQHNDLLVQLYMAWNLVKKQFCLWYIHINALAYIICTYKHLINARANGSGRSF